jgi:tyrosine-protein kinase Etk/Wzc
LPGYLGPAAQQESKLDLWRYVAAVLRHKWLVALATALGLAAGLGASRLVKPEYVAQATIWIGGQERGGVGATSRGPIQQGELLAAAGWRELLMSYAVLDAAVQRLRLYLLPDSPSDSTLFRQFDLAASFVPGRYLLTTNQAGTAVSLETDQGIVLDQVAFGDSLGRNVGLLWVPEPTVLKPGLEAGFTLLRPRDAARSLAERLRIRQDRSGSFLRLELSGSSPVRITNAVNEVNAQFVEVATELKRLKLTELAKILGDQLNQAEGNLLRAENALQEFRVRTVTLPSDPSVPVAAGLQITQDPVFRGFFELKVDRDEVARDKEAILEALNTAADSQLSVGAFEVIGAVQRSSEVTMAMVELTGKRAELRALRYRYTDDHPSVRRIAGEVAQLADTTIPGLISTLVADLDRRLGQFDDRISSASTELQQIPPRAIHEARLEREVSVADALYAVLQQRFEEARIAEASSVPDVQILDEAIVPERPVREVAAILVLMGIFFGMGAGVAGAVLLDRFDARVRYPDQVAGLGLPLLGVIPHLKGGKNGSRSSATAPVIEAVRGIRLDLVHSGGGASPLVFTVSSPGPSDGKSFVASNLALAFADAGYRTLLIDGDVRRGALHRVLSVSRKPGIIDFLSGNAGRDDILQDTEFSSLAFIGCGTRSSQAPELLGSASMAEFLTSMRSRFSVIVVDSPPLGAGVDAYALGALTGNLVLVLRLGATDKSLTEAKLDVLDRLPIRLLGAILNDVREGPAYRYYRYHSYYLPGYESEDEANEGARTEVLTKAKA